MNNYLNTKKDKKTYCMKVAVEVETKTVHTKLMEVNYKKLLYISKHFF